MRIGRRGRPVGPLTLGAALITVTIVAAAVILYKDHISTAFAPSSTIKAHLNENHGITPYSSNVKISGVEVGEVTGVEKEAGGAVVTIAANPDVPRKLRSQPSVRVRPTTLLGGNYFLDLVPGGPPGVFGGDIPRERSTVPVEQDKISRVFQPNVLDGLQGDLRHLRGVLGPDGRNALQNLVADAPRTLRPAAPVLNSAQGTHPEGDLPNLVGGLQNTAAALTQQEGQLQSTVHNLSVTSGVLGERSADVSRTVRNLPGTVDSTGAGFHRLDRSLEKLRATAEPARPTARRLNTTLDHLNPALVKARPLVHNLNGLLTDARPMVDELTPTAEQANAVLDDVRGPVLDRLNGPVKNTVLSPYHGTGHYQNSGNDHRFYQELAYMVTGMDRLAQVTDRNGATIGYGIGINAGTVGGTPVSLEQLFGHLTGIGEKEDR